MDSHNLVPVDALDMIHQNGVNQQSLTAVNENDNFGKVLTCGESTGNLENALHLDDSAANNSSSDVIGGLKLLVGKNGLPVSKDGVVKDVLNSEPRRPQGKSNDEKPLNAKNASVTQIRKGKDRKDAGAPPAIANGPTALNSRPKQTLKIKLFNEKHVPASKHSEKVDEESSDSLMEKAKLKPLKKGTAHNIEEDTQSLSPTTENVKPRKMGTLPNYGFSFKCDERAEKRKEFYTKLEEKIQAKEVEKSTLQAKSKETQEAEIKLLRKSLAFKATPMPNFYQEPPQPKTEPKKLALIVNVKQIPPTRPKSPKLGRRKSSFRSDTEGINCQTIRPGRLSLDEKVSQENPTKGLSPVPFKKPQRKSLPKLPSEKITLSNVTNATKEDNMKFSNEANQEAIIPPGEETVPS
ncbi:hypothetical protein K2173_009561 [Erythroxylum novogranatense]|uniref:TPX2 C-terminal domain-containing protein n=1 Tax=Erythroxylum novogranatense TaxID=1862640 RepID=A0AAV8U4E2_9ROSI|nr:hypothetical protein K2173_009561 [Erythroxylum novogranatense]